MKKLFCAFSLAVCLLGVYVQRVQPQIPDDCTEGMDSNGEAQIICEGSTIGGGGGQPNPPATSGGCTPGTTLQDVSVNPIGDGLYTIDPEDTGICQYNIRIINACTGVTLENLPASYGACPEAPQNAAANPCEEEFSISASGVKCETRWGIDYYLKVALSFPMTFLDLRPYPATLVRWPTAARNGGQDSGSKSDRDGYIGYGGGNKNNPKKGDWRDVTLTLSYKPAGPMFFKMPQVGSMVLPNVGPGGKPVLFSWELPSHPAAGGSTLAGTVSGLESLPDDIPLFVGSARSPYRLFWRLSYEKYTRKCELGPDPVDGIFNCKRYSIDYKPTYKPDNAHWDYKWVRRGKSGEITPQMVTMLSPGLAADIDRNGVPDAFWNNKVTIRRMDDRDRVGTREWGAEWSWGSTVYWAVREAQALIGRP